jgi:hypothetical protein
MKVDVQEFSANSALDYADLNKLVLAIKTLAAAMPTVTTPVPSAGSPTGTVTNAAPSFLTGGYTVSNAIPVSSTNTGSPFTVPFQRDGKPVTFSSPPFVVAWASTGGNTTSGLAVVNKAGNATTTGFNIRVGWVGRAKSGNVGISYLAIGNEIKS